MDWFQLLLHQNGDNKVKRRRTEPRQPTMMAKQDQQLVWLHNGHPLSKRLHANQERQNHGIVRDTIFRVERAMALFLASLVPGVGERHVRAREEARREAERIENERLAAENARVAEESAKNESSPQVDETHGESSTANSGEEVATSS
jgi:hypothetical protein